MATRLNEPAIRHLLTGPGGLVDRHFSPLAARVEGLATAYAPLGDTGALSASMKTEKTVVGAKVIWTIGSPLIRAAYTNCGTGIYAGNGPICAKRAKFLVFHINGRKIVTRCVKGQPAQGYMIKALRNGQPYPVTPLPC